MSSSSKNISDRIKSVYANAFRCFMVYLFLMLGEDVVNKNYIFKSFLGK